MKLIVNKGDISRAFESEQSQGIPKDCWKAIQILVTMARDFCDFRLVNEEDTHRFLGKLTSFESVKNADFDILFLARCQKKHLNIIYAPFIRQWYSEDFDAKYGTTDTKLTWKVRQAVLIEMKKNMGRILIRPETVIDKLAAVFGKNDIDFKEHSEFSRKYFVDAMSEEDEDLFRSAATMRVLDMVSQNEGMHIECNRTDLYLYSDNPLLDDCLADIMTCGFGLCEELF